MEKPKLGPEPSRCACGRNRTEAQIYVHQAHVALYVYHRCECGAEWTESRAVVDRTGPVSSDEVLEVHKHLANFEGSFKELIEKPTENPAAEK